MFCGQCGNNLADGGGFCGACGMRLTPSSGVPPAPTWQTVFIEPKTDNKAIASLVFGCLFFFFPAALLAIILGHLSLSEIRKSAGRMKGKGLATAGLTLGYFGLASIPVLFVFMVATLIPHLQRNRNVSRVQMVTREPRAISSIRALNTSEIGFQIGHPDAGFTCNLEDLVGSSAEYGWRDPELATGRKDGYIFVMQNCAAGKSGGPISKYQVTADPANHPPGLRAFCSDESGTLRYDVSGSGKKCLESGKLLP
jgi:hypothetical protein